MYDDEMYDDDDGMILNIVITDSIDQEKHIYFSCIFLEIMT